MGKLVPIVEHKYEYRVEDYERPYKDFGGKEELILQGTPGALAEFINKLK